MYIGITLLIVLALIALGLKCFMMISDIIHVAKIEIKRRKKPKKITVRKIGF